MNGSGAVFHGNFNYEPQALVCRPPKGFNNNDLNDSFHFYNTVILGTCLIKAKIKFRIMISEDYSRDWSLFIQ